MHTSLSKILLISVFVGIVVGSSLAASPVADFSGNPASGIEPLKVSFTDLSSGSPTGWVWFFGDETYTESWTQLPNAGWAGRYGHSSVVLSDGSILVMGGGYIGSYLNDVWKSTDNGISWTKLPNAGWSGRYGHSSVVLSDGSILVMGGGTEVDYNNQIWRSSDNGISWTQLPNAGWSYRYEHSSVVLPDGSILVMGGKSGGDYKYDTWRSSDNGISWTRLPDAKWSGRSGHSSVVMPDGSILVMGGYSGTDLRKDIWRSSDNGISWTQLPNAGWSGRYGHSSVVMPDSSILVMGGYNGNYLNTVWRSTNNGNSWTQLPNAGWSGRKEHTSVVLPDGSILVMGGYNDSRLNTVWRFNPSGSSAKNPFHTYSSVGTYNVSFQTYNADGYNSTRKNGYITIVNPPIAGFTTDLTSGTSPLTIRFNDTSSRDVTAWNWSFGDGTWFNTTDPDLRNTTKTYTQPGLHEARLIVSNIGCSAVSNTTSIMVDPPDISAVSPETVLNTGQQSVIITGTNFRAGAAVNLTNSTISISGTASVVKDTSIRCSFPLSGAPTTMYNLNIRNSDGTIGTKENALTVTNTTPAITAVSPLSGFNTSTVTVTVTGSSFRSGATASLVNGDTTLDGTITSRTLTKIVSSFNLTGAPAGVYNLTVLNIDGSSATKTNAFTVNAGGDYPTISAISPDSGANTGTVAVTITGTNFRTKATVTITNGTTEKTVAGTVTGTTTVKAYLPLKGLPLGLYNLTVRNTDDSSVTGEDAFTVCNPTPVISSVKPASGYTTGTVAVTIAGSRFITGAEISLDNATYSLPGSVSSFTVAKIVGSFDLTGLFPGSYNLTVTNPGGPNATKPFTVMAPGTDPLINTITPDSGVNTGTVPVTITGANFKTRATVTITNGSTEKTVTGTVTGTTSIKASLPLAGLPIGLYNLTVRNTDGSSVTGEDVFTVTNPTPSITSVSPASGYTTGSSTVTIAGSKFVSGAEISLDNATSRLPGSVSSLTAAKIVGSFDLSGLFPGSYNLTVTNPGGPNAMKPFTALAPGTDPIIDTITPDSGVNTGTVPVTITGANFRTKATVIIVNGTTSKTLTGTVTGTTTIRASLALNGMPFGQYNLTVRNTDGSSVTSENGFTVTTPTPAITSVSPASGYTTGAVAVTIRGSKFVTGAVISLDNATFSLPGSVSSFTTTNIVGSFDLTPLTPGSYNLTVTNPGGPNAMKPFTAMAPGTDPLINSITPDSGVNTGTVPVTITGDNFRTKATVTITNGITEKTITGTVTGTTIVKASFALKDLPIGQYNLTVRNTDGSSVTRENGFTVTNPTPTISLVKPTFGYTTGSSTVTITGSKYVAGAEISLDNTTYSLPGSVSSFGTTKIVGSFDLTGLFPGSYDLTVTNPGGPNATKPFTVVAPGTDPVISSITPDSGVNTGTVPVTITGANFRTKATVTITSGTTEKTVTGTVTGTTTLKASLPLNGLPIGQYNLTIRNTDGSSVTGENAFTVTNPTPAITSVSPASGYTTGTVAVTIKGSKYVTGAVISLDNATSIHPGSLSSLTTAKIVGSFDLTPLTPGSYNLTVSNPGNANGTKVNAFTVLSPGESPSISEINPASGFNTANLPVTITGANFRTAVVYLNQGDFLKKATATSGKRSTATTLYVTLPLRGLSGGYYNITVSNSDGVNATGTEIFYVTDRAWISSVSGTVSRSPVVQRPGGMVTRSIPARGVNPINRQVLASGVR